MSDRIDELVAAIDANTLLQWDGRDVALEAAHDLATIAREAEANAKGQEANAVFALQLKREAEARALKAEAMCKWLAKQWKVACDSDELPCHICPFADKGAPATCQSAEAMLKAAREAVTHER